MNLPPIVATADVPIGKRPMLSAAVASGGGIIGGGCCGGFIQ